MEPEVSERGLGWSQDAIRGRDADVAGVLLQVPNWASPKGGMLCHVLCHALGSLPEQGDHMSQTFLLELSLKFRGGWNKGENNS